MNPGAPSNNERSGDRDLYISGLLRRTYVEVTLKQCDVDSIPEMLPYTVCDRCSLPIVLIEFTRSPEYKATRYMEAWSKDMRHPVPVYCVRHNGSESNPATFFEIESRYCPGTHLAIFKKKVRLGGEKAFVEWVQNLYQQHLWVCSRKESI
jgi:hypothetical protein